MVSNEAVWFTPIILLPGIALFLISTSQRFSMITMDIKNLKMDDQETDYPKKKILLMRAKILGYTMNCLYLSLIFFCLSAVIIMFAKMIPYTFHLLAIPVILLCILTLLLASGLLIFETKLALKQIGNEFLK